MIVVLLITFLFLALPKLSYVNLNCLIFVTLYHADGLKNYPYPVCCVLLCIVYFMTLFLSNYDLTLCNFCLEILNQKE